MSTPDASYEVVAHPQAQREFDAIPEQTRDRLRDHIYEMAAHREPAEVSKAKPLDDREQMYRLRVGRHRCILARDGAELKLLTADHRDRAYDADRMAVAERRRSE